MQEPKTAENALHLDIRASDGERDATVARLLGLGVTRLWDGRLGPQTRVTLADPEGNEACMS